MHYNPFSRVSKFSYDMDCACIDVGPHPPIAFHARARKSSWQLKLARASMACHPQITNVWLAP